MRDTLLLRRSAITLDIRQITKGLNLITLE